MNVVTEKQQSKKHSRLHFAYIKRNLLLLKQVLKSRVSHQSEHSSIADLLAHFQLKLYLQRVIKYKGQKCQSTNSPILFQSFLLSFYISFLLTGLFNVHLDLRYGEGIIFQFNKSLYGTKANKCWYSITSCLWFTELLRF